MRLPAPALPVLACALALAPLAPLAGALPPAVAPEVPVAIAGDGMGTLYGPDGAVACADVPFVAQATYFPDRRGTLALSWALACRSLANGGVVALGQLRMGGEFPLTWEARCTGTPPEGLDCGVAHVGPIARGAWVEVRAADGGRTFVGAFFAA
jgi:hypothetical protein